MNLNDCRNHCEQVANQIRNIANNSTDQRSREMLTHGAGHLEMCIHNCDEALIQSNMR